MGLLMTAKEKAAVNKLCKNGKICTVCRFDPFCKSIGFSHKDGNCTFDEPYNLDLDLEQAVRIALSNRNS